MKISHSYQSTPSNHFLWLKDCVSFHFPGFPTSKTGGTKKNSSSTKGEELSKWCPFFVGVIPRLTSSQCCKMSCSSQEKLPFDAHKREKERNMFGSRKYFDRMGFPISENCCLASKKNAGRIGRGAWASSSCWKWRGSKPSIPQVWVEVCGETALRGGGDFPKKENSGQNGGLALGACEAGKLLSLRWLKCTAGRPLRSSGTL